MVIATVMLTIIGMTGGYLLSERRGPGPADAASSPTPDDSSSSAPALLPTDGLCPQRTQDLGPSQGAVGELGRVLEVATRSKTVIWICQDNIGQLFYHANKGGETAPWKEGITALFIKNVQYLPDGSFEGVASDGSRFNLTPERLLITKLDGSLVEQKARVG
ncbi:hypothetical protein Apa02nite_095940 [Actinoplanes palleronii]|uniref:Uncharacterized protein n=1 Tax=Actinoplanes palleronii TaxID=113570 RepID=A0ABQ4BS44_9ACTN|nr:hypothetical protein Apa02nite_095940 [Actinoplanes palleronii]